MEKQTRIICTLGPASRRPKTIRRLMEAGMDFARLNFSHGTAGDHSEMAEMVRDAARRTGRSVKLLQDLEGPKFRIGKMDHPVHFRTGDKTSLVLDDPDPEDIPLPNPELIALIKPGDRIFLDDGALELTALRSDPGRVLCEVRIGGRIDGGSGLQLPGHQLDLPALDEKDIADIRTGREIGVDVVAQSMVRTEKDVAELKIHLDEDTPIIAKIEQSEALQHLSAIARASWGLMVARGDLGVSIHRAEVPIWQKEILAVSHRENRFGVVATEMLLSMVKNFRPTRAEVSDVATAIFDGADAVMLSEETAVGRHPVEAVEEMRKIIETVETSRWFRNRVLAKPEKP